MQLDGVSWEDLAVLLAGIELGSLNRAAAALGIGQSTASRRLARLEERLNVQLFDRTPEGLLPTAFALDLAPHARLIAGHMEDIQRLADGQEATPAGRVRLAMVDGLVSQWLAPRLPAFFERWPGVELDLLAGHALVDLVRREADVAVRFARPTAPDLVAKKLGTLTFHAYAHPDLAGSRIQRWVALNDPLDVFQESHWIRDHARAEHLIQVSDWTDLLACVCNGVGAGVLSPLVAENRGLVRVDCDLPPVPSRDLYLVYHRALRDVPRIAVLRKWLVRTATEFLEGPAPT